MTGKSDEGSTVPGASRLWAEFAVLYVAVPAANLAFFDTLGPFLPLIVVFLIACILLSVTPEFHWREVVDVRGLARHVPLVAGLFALCLVVVLGCVMVLVPGNLFGFPRHDFGRYALVVALYPFLSALGQEIAYRLLFFRRYRRLFPGNGAAIAASALAFSFAHAFFQNWVAVTLTLAGGLVFAWAFVRYRSFPLVWLLHTLAGWTVFTVGLGAFFYHGAIPG